MHSSKKIILLYEKGELTRDYKSLTGEIKEKKEYDLKSLSENSDSLAIDMLFIFLEKFEVETIKFREKFEGHQKEIWKDWAVA